MITCAMPLLEGVNEDDQQVVELALNDWGTRILVKAKKQICLFDAGNGDLLQTLKRTTPLWGRNPGTEGMYISPEARTVATRTDPPQGVKNPQATIAFYDAETGRATCAANLEHDLEVDEGNVVFAPDGRTLFVCGRLHGKICAQALSARSGASRMLNLPVAGKINCRLEMLTPCPGGSALLGSWGGDRIADKHPSRLSVLNLQGSSERLLQSADIAPFRGLWDRRIAVSPDGRLALIEDMERKQSGHFEVVDFQTDAQLFKHTETDAEFDRGCFTPDGKRFLILRGPHYVILHFNAGPGVPFEQHVPASIQLYEIASQQKIGEYVPPAAPTALVVSGNGNKIAFSHGKRAFVVSFSAAFGIGALPPLPPVEDYTAR